VLARGYTYAEDGYPITLPSTQFRIASCSKLITALAIWRMLYPPNGGPGAISLDDTLQGILDLTPPPGHTLAAGFEQITVRDLLEMRSGLLYEVAGRSVMEQAARQLKASLPLSAAQAAAYLSAYPLGNPPYGYNNSGYAMLGNILARKLAPGTADLAHGYLQAIMASVMTPLRISNVGLAGTLESELAPTEARYDASVPADYTDPTTGNVVYHKVQDLCLLPSVMHDDGRLVPAQYGGWYNHALMGGAAGLRIAMPDLARVLAALNVTSNNPLFEASTLPDLFASAQAANALDYWNLHGCYGWDAVRSTGDGAWYAEKGGYVFGAQSVVRFTTGGLCFAMAWNFDNVQGDWSPDFPEVLGRASGANVSASDLFSTYDAHMSPL
jgi:CubicO group peptidase (beta-lactamase class C family)